MKFHIVPEGYDPLLDTPPLQLTFVQRVSRTMLDLSLSFWLAISRNKPRESAMNDVRLILFNLMVIVRKMQPRAHPHRVFINPKVLCVELHHCDTQKLDQIELKRAFWMLRILSYADTDNRCILELDWRDSSIARKLDAIHKSENPKFL